MTERNKIICLLSKIVPLPYRTITVIAGKLLEHGCVIQKRGRWEAYPDEYQICATEFVCSCCNVSFANSELASDNDYLEMMKFCPNCGADMRERKDNGKE